MKTRITVLFALVALFFGGFFSFAQEYVEAPKFRIAVQGGYGRRLAKYQATNNELIDNHNRRLFGGLDYGADMTYYFSDSYGFGLKYNNMHTISKDAVVSEDGRSGMYSEAMDIMFVGPMMSTRKVGASGNGIFMLNYGLGYLGYDDYGRIIDDTLRIKGGTLGVCLELGYDYRIANNIFLGANLGAMSGTLTSCTVTTNGHPVQRKLDKDEYESLLHAYLTLGVRYYL